MILFFFRSSFLSSVLSFPAFPFAFGSSNIVPRYDRERNSHSSLAAAQGTLVIFVPPHFPMSIPNSVLFELNLRRRCCFLLLLRAREAVIAAKANSNPTQRWEIGNKLKS
jgi:hypothetical protein